MERLFQVQERRLARISLEIVRQMINVINWDDRLISIRGSRGVGKTTLMLQYIKMNYGQGTRKALYCTLDSFYFNNNSLLDLTEEFYLHGGRHLFVDEVHKYPGWHKEIKEIYDAYPDLRVVISGSSMLHLLNSDTDLSRRCLPYYMPGLSLREYLRFYKGISLPSVKLDELMANPGEIAAAVTAVCSPVAVYREYCREGFYPFYNGNKEDYYLRIENVVNFIVEQELPLLAGLQSGYARKIKAMLGVLATSKPFALDVSKMSRMLELNRETVMTYLHLLEKADLLYLLYSDVTSVKRLQKPDKVYLTNPNLLTALATDDVDEGNMRETFVVSQVSPFFKVEYGKEAGDFIIDGRWRVEVGGAKKGFSQIANLPDSYILADNIEYPSGNRLPLWLMGFLY